MLPTAEGVWRRRPLAVWLRFDNVFTDGGPAFTPFLIEVVLSMERRFTIGPRTTPRPPVCSVHEPRSLDPPALAPFLPATRTQWFISRDPLSADGTGAAVCASSHPPPRPASRPPSSRQRGHWQLHHLSSWG